MPLRKLSTNLWFFECVVITAYYFTHSFSFHFIHIATTYLQITMSSFFPSPSKLPCSTPILEREKKVLIRGKIPNKFEIWCYSGRYKILPQFVYAERKAHCSILFFCQHPYISSDSGIFVVILFTCVRETQTNV